MSTTLQRVRQDATMRICVWAGDEQLTVQALGEMVVLPSRDEIAEAGKGVFRFGAAVDRQGSPIPGTVCLREMRQRRDDTSMAVIFDPIGWADMLESNAPKLFKSGFGITDDPDNVPEMQKAQRPQWEQMDEERCVDVLHAELERQDNYRKKYPGEPIPAGSNDAAVQAAQARLQSYKQRKPKAAVSRDEILKTLGSGTDPVKELVTEGDAAKRKAVGQRLLAARRAKAAQRSAAA